MAHKRTARRRQPARSPRSRTAQRSTESRPRHQRILVPKSDSTRADLRLTIIVFSVVALMAILDFATVRSGNGVVLAVLVLGYSFFRSFQGWSRYLGAGASRRAEIAG